MSTGSPPPTPLAYGRQPHWRGRRVIRVAVIAAVIAGAVLAYDRRQVWVPPVRQWWSLRQLARSEARCLAFVPPADQVAYTDVPAAPVGLGASRIGTGDGWTAVVWQPAVWRDFLGRADLWNAAGGVSGQVPSATVQSSTWTATAVCALHDRRAPDGTHMLVGVTLDARGSLPKLDAVCWSVGTASALPRGTWGDSIEIERSDPGDWLTVGVARLDAADESAFDVPYRIGTRAGTVHGHLTATGVTLKPDDGWLDAAGSYSVSRWLLSSSAVCLHDRRTADYFVPYPPPNDGDDPVVMAAQLAFTADNQRLLALLGPVRSLAAPEPDRLVGWDRTTLQLKSDVLVDDRQHAAASGAPRAMLSPDGTLCATLTDRYDAAKGRFVSTVRGIDPQTGREVGRTLVGPAFHCRLLGFAVDGRTVYCGGDQQLAAVDTEHWRERASAAISGDVRSFAAAQTRVAVVSASSSAGQDHVAILSADTLAQIGSPDLTLLDFTFTPDGRRLLSYDQLVHVPGTACFCPWLCSYDTATGAGTRIGAGGPYGTDFYPAAHRSAFSPDGHWWAVADRNHTYLFAHPTISDVWRLDTPALRGSAGPPAFSPDGRWLATATDAGVAVWSVPR